jgi:cytochrome c556
MTKEQHMQGRKLIVAAVVIVALAAPVFAYQEVSPADYDAAMKSIRATMGGVADHMSAQSASDVGADGDKFVEAFTKVDAYWKGRNDATAMELAAKALAAARQFQEAGAAGNFDAAQGAFGEMRSTCMPCHESYRERDADGNWQIKMDR